MGFDIGKIVGGAVNAGRNLVDKGRDVVENVVDKGQQVVGNVVDTTRDVFETATEKVGDIAAPVVDFVRGDSSDKVHDGKQLYLDGSTRPAGAPLERDPSKPLVLQVNGISTTLNGQMSALKAVQAHTGAQVIGVHNATEGMLRDLGQAALDTANKGKNPAVDSLADTMYAELEAGRPVHIMAHSQGGLITSRAVEQVKQRLMMEGGMTSDQAEAKLQNVQIESFGSAAPSWPDGPQYVHYVNRADPVPTALGLGPGIPGVGNPGEGAQVRYFFQTDGAHNFNDTYLDQRVPFDQAYSGDFTQRGENRV
ncbi:MAG: hypothetical protein M3Y59_06510 [Myxococcota bacterium]|nr:hypothetical protein [Myxococcota bacterium]